MTRGQKSLIIVVMTMNGGNLTNRQIKAQQTRARIIAAADRLIKERGFDAVNVADITDEAGVAKGSFYSYFQRKEDIFSEIAYTNFDAIYDRALERYQGAYGRISMFLLDSMSYIRETGIRVSQQWARSVVDPADRDGVKKLTYDREIIFRFLREAVVRGELSNETPVKALADGVIAAYYGMVFCWAITDGELDPLEAMRAYCEGPFRLLIEAYRSGDGE